MSRLGPILGKPMVQVVSVMVTGLRTARDGWHSHIALQCAPTGPGGSQQPG
jgi:hypothetical protein